MTINVTKSVIGLDMTKAPVKVNEHFVVTTDEKGNDTEVIYNPPLLAETENIRVELRKEKNHNCPHVHIIKKGRNKTFDVSVALDDLSLLAGSENVQHFDDKEWDKLGEFLFNNQSRFIKLYATLRGDL